MKILAIDDDRSALESLCEVLEKEGYEVEGTTDSARALEIISEKHTELGLVLSDLRMDEVDGMAVLDRVRTVSPGVPVILLTAFADMESAIEAIHKGAFDYLSKPYRLNHLRVVVRRAMEQSRLRRENRQLRSVLEQRAASPRSSAEVPK